MSKRLYRSTTNKMLGGVCAGMADYFDIDPTLIRLIAVVALLASGGLAVPAYIVGWIIVPRDDQFAPQGGPGGDPSVAPAVETQPSSEGVPESPSGEKNRNASWQTYLPGIILIGLGCMFLIKEYFWISFSELWPIFLILVGLGLIMWRSGRKTHFDPYAENQSQPTTGQNVTGQPMGSNAANDQNGGNPQ